MKFILTAFIFAIFTFNSYSENIIISGKVLDRDTKETIAGATISVIGTKKGTYSSAYGNYKLPIPEGSTKIKVTSYGYFPREISVTEPNPDFTIELIADTINIKGVTVIGDIDADNIIRRAIEKKKENADKLKTFSGLLYSKLAMTIDGKGFMQSDGTGFSVGTSFSGGEDENDATQMFILETFSNAKSDFVQNKSKSEIIQRRQTANISPDNNLLAITSFRNFFNDVLDFGSIKIHTPLSKDAFKYYRYELEERAIYGDRYIYSIKVIPKTKTFPSFQGNIKIVEDTYDLVELDLKPSESTAIPFVNEINFKQKFEEIGDNVWYPMFLDITGKANIDIIKGIMAVEADLTATSIYSDVEVNIDFPEGTFDEKEQMMITVSETADSTDIGFWENNSLRKIEPRELEMYAKVDTILQVDDPLEQQIKNVCFSVTPYLDFNRVGSVSLGASPEVSFFKKKISLSGFGAYSFGLQRPIGETKLNLRLLNNELITFNLNGGAFSRLNTMSFWEDYPPIVNMFTSLVGRDYFDYYSQDGWFAGFDAYHKGVKLTAFYENSRHYSEQLNTRNVIDGFRFRINPRVTEESYQTAAFHFEFGEIPFVEMSREIYYELKFKALATKIETDDELYPGVTADASVSLPLFNTGYNPMRLRLDLSAGTASKNMPLQYQFKMPTRLFVIANPMAFRTAEISEFGGYEFLTGNAEINITDIWWRALRLPTYEGRGVDLVLAGSASNFKSDNFFYRNMDTEFYSEVGFGLRRIPTFISNVLYLAFDARWGIGNLASDRFGWTLGVSLPF